MSCMYIQVLPYVADPCFARVELAFLACTKYANADLEENQVPKACAGFGCMQRDGTAPVDPLVLLSAIL